MARRLVVRFEELPPRPSPLARGEVSQVFGGCGQANTPCASDQDCCDQTYTIPNTSIHYYLRCKLTSYGGSCGWT
jgi:hypothetical protein